MPSSLVRKREPASRRLCAVVTVLAFGWSGCAVRTWHPVPEPGLGSLERKTVRAVCRAGGVEFTVSGYSPPYLTGTCRPSSSREVPCSEPVRVDVRECSRLEVLRLDARDTVARTALGTLATGLAVFGTLALLAVAAVLMCGQDCDIS